MLHPYWSERKWIKVPIKGETPWHQHRPQTEPGLGSTAPMLSHLLRFPCVFDTGCYERSVNFYEAGMRSLREKKNAWIVTVQRTVDSQNRYLNIQSTWYIYCCVFAPFPCGLKMYSKLVWFSRPQRMAQFFLVRPIQSRPCSFAPAQLRVQRAACFSAQFQFPSL